MNFCACCWLKGSISDGQVGQWWSSMARRLSFLSLESTFKLLAQKALLRKTGKASAKLLPMSIFDKSASKPASSVKMGPCNQDLGCRRTRVLMEPRTWITYLSLKMWRKLSPSCVFRTSSHHSIKPKGWEVRKFWSLAATFWFSKVVLLTLAQLLRAFHFLYSLLFIWNNKFL